MITGRRYNTAMAAADNDGLIAYFRVIAFLYGTKKSITINMSYGELGKLRM